MTLMSASHRHPRGNYSWKSLNILIAVMFCSCDFISFIYNNQMWASGWLILRNITGSNEGRIFSPPRPTTSHEKCHSFIQSIAEICYCAIAEVLVFCLQFFLMSCLILMGLWWKWKSGRWRRKKILLRAWAWKMKIFPINTKLNEHDFWDIDGFQFFFVFHLCEKEWRKLLFRYFSASRPEKSWERERKSFSFFSTAESRMDEWNGWWGEMAFEGTQKLFSIARYCWWEMARMYPKSIIVNQ